jgi:hypothetical protein
MSNTVQLAVYDLSRGMMASMSQQFLGYREEGMWHTGIRVFNKEWYFGGGIQVSPIGYFERNSGLNPTRLETLQTTTKTEIELRQFISSINNQWTALTYNLISHNCNNFSDMIARFLCGHGISNEIIELPTRVFSSPMGQMIRPLVDGMQSTINQDTRNTFDPFGGIGGSGTAAITQPQYPQTQPQSQPINTQIPVARSVSSTSTSTSTSTSISTSTSTIRSGLDEVSYVSAVSEGAANMVSRMMTLKVKKEESDNKIKSNRSSSGTFYGVCSYCKRSNFNTEEAFKVHERDMPCKTLLSGKGTGPSAGGVSSPDKMKDEEEEIGESLLSSVDKETITEIKNWIDDHSRKFPIRGYETLIRLANTHHQTQTPAYFILRILVAGDIQLKEQVSGYHNIVAEEIYRLLRQLLVSSTGTNEEDSGLLSLKNISATVMALCSLSNWLGTVSDIMKCSLRDISRDYIDEIVDVAVSFLSHDRVEIRQIAGALAYNYTLQNTRGDKCSQFWGGIQQGNEIVVVELHAHVVQLLCCSLENLSNEQDPVVRKRRLAIALRILRSNGTVAVDFVRELGFHSSFTSILSQLQAVAGNVDNGNTIDSEITIIQNLIHITSTATSTVVRGVPII